MITGQTHLTAKGMEGLDSRLGCLVKLGTADTLHGPVCENRLTRMKFRLEVRTICQV